jgi:hypothetical protein
MLLSRVKISNLKFSNEYEKYQRCLDRNDWRHVDCRKEQQAFLEQWNQYKGFSSSAKA